jgi:hypothetical protein
MRTACLKFRPDLTKEARVVRNVRLINQFILGAFEKRRIPMQKILGIVAFAALSSALPQLALAQPSTPENSAARATLQAENPGGTWSVIQAQVKNSLEQEGYKNVQIMPSSFIVKAEKDGHALMLVINSDSETVTYLSADQKTSLPQGNAEQPNSIGAPANLPANAGGAPPKNGEGGTAIQQGKMGETEGVPSRH